MRVFGIPDIRSCSGQSQIRVFVRRLDLVFLAHGAALGDPTPENDEIMRFNDGSAPGRCGEFGFGDGGASMWAATAIFAILRRGRMGAKTRFSRNLKFT